jgi:hypothetical protein
MIKHKSKKRGGKVAVVASSRVSPHLDIETEIQQKMRPEQNEIVSDSFNLTLIDETPTTISLEQLKLQPEKHCFDIKPINLNAANKLILNNKHANIEKEIIEMIKTINKNSLGKLKDIVNTKINTINKSSSANDIQQIYLALIQDYKKNLTADAQIIETNLNEFKQRLTKGGGVLQHLYDNSDPDLEAVEYIQYVKDRGDADVIADYENKDLALIQTIVDSTNIPAIRTNILKKIDTLRITSNDYNKYDSFFNFIFHNKDKVSTKKNLEIPAEEKFEITNLKTKGARDENGNQGNILSYTYDAYNYNEDIVIDFERKLYENQEYIKEFMTKQNDFIESNLNPMERWTIRDYTSYTANPFYGAYKTSKILNTSDWFHRYKADTENFIKMKFDNAYLPQILKYIDTNSKFSVLKTYINNNLTRLLNIVQYHGELSLDERYSSYVADVQDKILFTQKDWENILDIFEEDVNKIIKKMPTPENPIYCYRGVTYHYVSLNAWDARGVNPEYSLNCYYLSRITSLSLYFDKAKYFYESLDKAGGENPDKHLYRAVIMPGCNMLFVSSLSALPDEYEIILPTYSVVLDAKGWNEQLNKSVVRNLEEYQRDFNARALNRIKYNNRTNVKGICGREQDKLISSDIVIIGTFGEDSIDGRLY